jgi:hypothetical protein
VLYVTVGEFETRIRSLKLIEKERNLEGWGDRKLPLKLALLIAHYATSCLSLLSLISMKG